MRNGEYVVEERKDNYTGASFWVICWIEEDWGGRSAAILSYSYKTREIAEKVCVSLNNDKNRIKSVR